MKIAPRAFRLNKSLTHGALVLPLLLASHLFFGPNSFLGPKEAGAQVDVVITPADSEFTIAVPPLCADGDAAEAAKTAAATVARDMLLTGSYQAEGPEKHPKPLGACTAADGGPFTTNLNSLGVNLLVSGKARFADDKGRLAIFDFYAYDVAKSQAVLGKRYEGRSSEAESFAHQFANELLAYLTGDIGAFGSQIVYVSESGSHKELFAMRLGSAERTQLTEEKGKATAPSWSPKGDKIIFSLTKGNFIDLFTIPARGGKAQRITFLPGGERTPRISPDGKTIITAAEISGAQSLALFNFRGRLTEKLTESTSDSKEPAWSPDGRNIAFTSNQGGREAIYLISAQGGRIRPLAERAGSNCGQAAWSPSGEELALVCTLGSEHQLFLKSLTKDELVQLTFQGDNQHPTWSPDGRFIAFSTRRADKADRDIAVFSVPALKTTVVLKTPSDDSEPSWAP